MLDFNVKVEIYFYFRANSFLEYKGKSFIFEYARFDRYFVNQEILISFFALMLIEIVNKTLLSLMESDLFIIYYFSRHPGDFSKLS